MESQQPTLVRAVSRWQVVGLALNDVIGSGIYLLPAAAAALLGPLSLAAVVVAGLTVLLVVLCFAEASSYFDQPGSSYLYARTAFGDLVGFEVGWMTWMTSVASEATLAAGFAQSLEFLVPGAATGWVKGLVITGAIVGLTLINLVGIRSGVGAAIFLVIGKLVPLVLFIGAGFFFVSWDVVESQAATVDGGLGAAALLLLFAYAGFENAPAAAGEYKNPQRDVPFALVTHIAIVTLVYVLVQFVALGVLPEVGSSRTPLADAARLFLGSPGGWLLTFGAAISILGSASNTVLAGPRYLYALAVDGYGPRALTRIHPRYRTPAVAIVTQMVVSLPLALTGSFEELAALSVVTRLVIYFGTSAAVPVLRRTYADHASGFRLPGGMAIPIAASAVSLALAVSATRRDLLIALVAAIVGLGIYALRRRPGAEAGPR